MRIERTKNATRNIVFGGIQRIYSLLLPFFMRTLLIYFLGVQYLGLNGLFSSILQVLNLAELGVGSAMVYSMYEPIAKDDSATICALMRLYRKYYRYIGCFIGLLGIILLPFIPKLINQDSLNSLPSDVNLYVLYILNLSTTVLTYWLFAYKNCLLNAHQRNDVSSKISLCITTIQYVLQIAAICIFRNYYIYLIVALLAQIISNIVTAFIVSKMYPNYSPEGVLEEEKVIDINKRIKDLFTAKVGGMVTYSADTIVISAYLGLTVLAIYQNYYYLITAVTSMLAVITSACTAGIGNSFVVETQEKNYRDLRTFTFIIVWISGICCSCFLNLFQPFMKLWVGEKLMFDFLAVVFFCIYFLSTELNAFFSVFKDASGRWHEDRFRPLVCSILNLSINIMLVKICGIYGVMASTFLVQFAISIPWLLHTLFNSVYDRSLFRSFLLQLTRYIGAIAFASSCSFICCSLMNSSNEIITFLVRLPICLFVADIIFYWLYHKTEEFKDTVILIKRIIRLRFSTRKQNI